MFLIFLDLNPCKHKHCMRTTAHAPVVSTPSTDYDHSTRNICIVYDTYILKRKELGLGQRRLGRQPCAFLYYNGFVIRYVLVLTPLSNLCANVRHLMLAFNSRGSFLSVSVVGGPMLVCVFQMGDSFSHVVRFTFPPITEHESTFMVIASGRKSGESKKEHRTVVFGACFVICRH